MFSLILGFQKDKADYKRKTFIDKSDVDASK
jgi:hypothetical protein